MPSRGKQSRPQRAGETPRRPDWPIGVALAVGAAALYLCTMCRTIHWGDTVEFILVADTLGIAHPSGYPTFIVLGKLATVLPGPSVPVAVNGLTALAAGGGVLVFWFLARGWFAATWAAALATAVFAVSAEFWTQATAAEVYALQALLVAAVLLAALRHARRPSVGSWLALCLLWGLSLTNHLTAALLIVPIAYIAATTWRHFAITVRRAALGLLAVAAGLAPYLYLPLRSARDPLYDQGNPETWRELLTVVSGGPFRYRLLSESAGTIAIEILSFPVKLADQITWVGVALALAGAVVLARRRPHLFAVTVLVMAPAVIYTACYNIPDKSGYYLPAYLICALWLGAAAHGLWEWLRARRRIAAYALAAAAIALPAWQAATNFRLIDKRDDRSLLDYAVAVERYCEPDAVVLCEDVNAYWALEWLRHTGRAPRSLRPVSIYWARMPWYLDAVAESGVIVPGHARETLAALPERLAAASPWEFAVESERAADEVACQIAAANIDQRPVLFCPGAGVQWVTEWRHLHLQLRGLVYYVSAEPLPMRPFPVQFAPPARYRADLMPRPEGRYVAQRFSTALNRLGIIWADAEHDHRRAAQAMERALEYEPDYAGAHKNLGLLYSGSPADAQRAIRHFRRFLEIEPDAPDAEDVRERIEQLQEIIQRGWPPSP